MKNLFIFVFFALAVSIVSVPSTASAVVCGDISSLGQTCSAGGNNGICVESENGIYCSVMAVTNSGLNPNAGTGGGQINLTLLQGYKTSIVNIINDILVPVLFAIAFITFFWGAFKYFIWGAENEMEKADGRKFAMWGIIGFVIILSIWGLVNLVTSTLALPNNNPPNTPRL